VKEKSYQIFEHTADIGVRVKGRDLNELFKSAGLALFQISSRRQFIKSKKRTSFTIRQSSSSLEELFINWLNELLSLSSAKGVIFHDIKIIELGNNKLEAVAVGSNLINYKVDIEIKAATYHKLKIEHKEAGWIAEFILDV